MRRFAITVVAAIAFVVGAPIMGTNVRAAPIVALGTIDNMNMVERVQFIWLGHNYCWYDDGWNGPGWYWCGYAFNSGYGWAADTAGIIGAGDIQALITMVAVFITVDITADIMVAITADITVGMAEGMAAADTAGIIPISASRKTSSRWHGSTMASASIASAIRGVTTRPMWA